jgi:hypothetical protein
MKNISPEIPQIHHSTRENFPNRMPAMKARENQRRGKQDLYLKWMGINQEVWSI